MCKRKKKVIYMRVNLRPFNDDIDLMAFQFRSPLVQSVIYSA